MGFVVDSSAALSCAGARWQGKVGANMRRCKKYPLHSKTGMNIRSIRPGAEVRRRPQHACKSGVGSYSDRWPTTALAMVALACMTRIRWRMCVCVCVRWGEGGRDDCACVLDDMPRSWSANHTRTPPPPTQHTSKHISIVPERPGTLRACSQRRPCARPPS